MTENEQNELTMTDEAVRLAKMLRLTRLALFGMYSDSSGQLSDDLETVIRFLSDASNTLEGLTVMLIQAEQGTASEAQEAVH